MHNLPVMSFESLDDATIARGWRMARALTRSADDADEVLQQAVIVAWRKQDSIPQDAWPWFATVVRNCWRNFSRKNARVQAMDRIEDYLAEPQGRDPGASLESHEVHALLHRELQRLPEDEREAVTLCFIAGLSYADAGRILNVNVNTLKGRVARAMEKLRQRMRRHAGSMEAYLATIAFAPPQGGFDASIARWKQTAIAREPFFPVTRTGSSQLTMAAGAAVSLGVLLFLAFWLGPLGDDPAARAKQDALAAGEGSATGPAGNEGSGDLPAARVGGASRLPGVPLGPDIVDPGQPVAGQSGPAQARKGPAVGEKLYWCKQYYPDGPLEFEWMALGPEKGATKQGLCIRYGKTGAIIAIGQYHDNKREGEWFTYFENGDISARGVNQAGNREGLWTYWHESGAKMCEGECHKDDQTGLWHFWRPDGTLERTRNYKQGRVHGWVIDCDETGRKHTATLWNNGKATERTIDLRLDPDRALPDITDE